MNKLDENALLSGEKMHVTRPKSSKGRSRPMMAHTHSVDTPAPYPSLSPQPPTAANDRLNQCLRSRALLRSSSQSSAERLAEVFDRPPDKRVSLNRYRVLPSIERKSADNITSKGTEVKAVKPSQVVNSHRICNHQLKQQIKRDPTEDQDNLEVKTPNQSDMMSEGPESETDLISYDEPDLLLAIRTPCGQRFKCHFKPTDELQAVLSAAEAEFGEKFENCLIETMEVPRRTFTKLTMTLAQCGVLNKSVLCISQDDSAMDLT